MTYSIGVQPEAGGCVIELSGDIDAAASDQLASTLESAVGHSADALVIVDLADANSLDSRSIGILASWQARLRASGGRLALAGSRPEVVRLFELIGLAETFEFHGGIAEARDGGNTQES